RVRGAHEPCRLRDNFSPRRTTNSTTIWGCCVRPAATRSPRAAPLPSLRRPADQGSPQTKVDLMNRRMLYGLLVFAIACSPTEGTNDGTGGATSSGSGGAPSSGSGGHGSGGATVGSGGSTTAGSGGESAGSGARARAAGPARAAAPPPA